MENWKLPAAIALSVVGNCIAWFHMNAQFKWSWANSQWFIDQAYFRGEAPFTMVYCSWWNTSKLRILLFY